MKGILKFVLAVMGFMAVACNEKGMDDIREDESSTDVVSHEMIVLGKQLEDPYSVGNVTKAIANLYPTKANRVDVTPTDIYVRFLPEDEQQYQYLVDQGYDLMDHPLDYQIVKDGDYYHDPEVDEEGITWQYAVLPKERNCLPISVMRSWTSALYLMAGPSLMTESIGLKWKGRHIALPGTVICWSL